MSRIFRDCEEMIREIDRELYVSGITVPVNHYQNKILTGDNRLTKELIGVNFTISKPHLKRQEMLKFIFKDEAKKIDEYCWSEWEDRMNRDMPNPGKSYLIRKDLWQELMGKELDQMFDYTYSERLHTRSQFDNMIGVLKEDINSRRAMILIFNPEDMSLAEGANTRIPCSVSYQFLIRHDRIHCIYYIRSNDYFKHFAIDIWMAVQMMKQVQHDLNPWHDLKMGSLTYMAGSLHAYNEDLTKWTIY